MTTSFQRRRAQRSTALRARTASPAVLAVAILLAPASAHAQATDWPIRPVAVVLGYAAGGNTDVMARMASKTLTEGLKQSFVVDNRIGAGGAIAASYVAQAAPDGYTLFFAASPQIAIVPQIQKVSYDPMKDFAPVSIFGTGPFVLGINSSIRTETGGSVGLGFAISGNQARKISQELIRSGQVKHADMNVNVKSVSAETSEGAQVQNVPAGGAAAAAGIQEGDVITKVGNRMVRNAAELVVAVREHEIGQTVQVTLARQGRELKLDVTLKSD